ncbi:MAG: metalloprotease [Candidatus Syntrophoarchaeum caldarius]|uniref:Zinc metalloprotease n=1 Tax=Candidatus Syntropharchaeum caldarium TaxID=1838285 RepID=A0A1F2PBZ1_9EURY|nr:MAG: metalloprotease [Candidatus Syntrophoarchaeum caldarius]
MRTSIEIGKAMGIPIKLHITFLLILPPFILVFMNQPAPFGFAEVEPPVARFILASTTTLILFACVIAHELAHSYVAMRYGVVIESITLFIFGGIASMKEIPRDPKIESRIAVAGPITSILIGSTFLMLHVPFSTIHGNVWWNGFGILAFAMGYINIVLAAFNLLPAFPMDGGRILRAYLATRGSSYLNATRRAVQIGKIFAILMGTFGLIYGGWMLILIAFFIYIAASEEESATSIQMFLEGVRIKDIISRDVVTVSPDITAQEFLDFVLTDRHRGYPVVDNFGTLIGVVSLTDVKRVPPEKLGEVKVRDIMTKDLITISEDVSAADVLRLMNQYNVGRLLVVKNGMLVGILSKTDLIRLIEILRM